jgi:serine/threonine-protein kinase SRPK1
MKNILKLKPWSLMDVLTTKYEWERSTAQAFVNFLLPMLVYEQGGRATAGQCLAHPFLAVLGSKEV